MGHAHHGQQGQLLSLSTRPRAACAARRPLSLLRRSPIVRQRSRGALLTCAIALGVAAPMMDARAQTGDAEPHQSDVRAATRLFQRGSTAVTETQASELTLTLTEAAMRPI